MLPHYFIYMILALPSAITTYDKFSNFRTRRNLLLQPHQRNNQPFVIRVPYSKIVAGNPIFTHSVAWKAKPARAKNDDAKQQNERDQQQPLSESEQLQQSQQQQQQRQSTLAPPPPPPSSSSEVEISQFHSQDTNGQVVFGFNSPDQMRIETRNADGTVHGTYSYLDPTGQVIKRQYWDTGAGFHVTSDTYPLNNVLPNGAPPSSSSVQYTPEVQAARDLHFQLYQQALASLLPNRGNPNIQRENVTATSAEIVATTEEIIASSAKIQEIETNNVTLSAENSNVAQDRIQENVDDSSDDDNVEDSVTKSNTQNGSIVIQNPEYLRISWTTDNRKYRVDSYHNNTENGDVNRVQIATARSSRRVKRAT